MEIGPPAEEPPRGLHRAGEDDAVHSRIRDEVAPDLVVAERDELEDVARDARVPECAGQVPADQHRLRRGLEQHRVAGGQRGEHSARGDRQREVPRRRHHDDAERLHAGAVHLIARAEGARVVAGEVDRLGHLRIRLGHRLGAVDDHGADQVAAPPGEHRRGAVEEPAPLLRGTRSPCRLRDAGRVERAIELRAVGEPVAVGDAARARAIASLRLPGPFDELTRDLERHRLRRALAPGLPDALDPLAVGGQRPVGVRLVHEGSRKVGRRHAGLGGSILLAPRRVRQIVEALEGLEEAVALEVPVG